MTSTHGGPRPGSGRKSGTAKPVTALTIRLPPALHAALEAEKERLELSWPVMIEQMAECAGIWPAKER